MNIKHVYVMIMAKTKWTQSLQSLIKTNSNYIWIKQRDKKAFH